MATKKTIGVMKYEHLTITGLSQRTRRELQDEVEKKAADGWEVVAMKRRGDGTAELHLSKTVPWTIDDLMSELDEYLAK